MKDFRDWRRRKMTPRWSRRRHGTFRLRRLAPAVWLAAPLLAALLLPLAVIPLRRDHTAPPAVPKATATAKAHPAAQNLPAAPDLPASAPAPQPKISVYLSRSGQIESLPLEDYVTGVIAAEMPADFELEALKAQAVAARTFILRRLVAGDVSGVPVPGAIVTDTVSHQAYVSKATLERQWERGGKSAALAKLRRAVKETRGVIMTYKGEPITASFFASSGGYTENSEEYWSAVVPYLRSVASPWEQDITPNFKVKYTFSTAELLSKLGVSTALKKDSIPVSGESSQRTKTQSVSASSSKSSFIKILSLTAGHHIKEISIGGVVFTGREVREKLQLRSSQFTWRIQGSQIVITTYGNGHSVGMSQWGANGMARDGKTATQILKHYYSGVSFNQVSTLLKK
ncbi:MAG: stage II sporulation protein D [Paenibacillus sp.]|nr:stage II sporulation protein D [Paenibacillus sp.]